MIFLDREGKSGWRVEVEVWFLLIYGSLNFVFPSFGGCVFNTCWWQEWHLASKTPHQLSPHGIAYFPPLIYFPSSPFASPVWYCTGLEQMERESNVDNWLTQVLPKGGPFNWCVCVWLCVCGLVVTVWEPDVIWFPLQNAYWRRLNVLRLLQCSAGHVLQAAQGALSWTSQGTKGIYRCYILSMLCVLLLC